MEMAFSKADCPAGVINACCICVDATDSAIILCILGVSISSRTAFWISIDGLEPLELDPEPEDAPDAAPELDPEPEDAPDAPLLPPLGA